jgi:CDP-diacylglycerol--glycerol-3-phosphate 3-phosphatidyltransferase
MPTWLPNALTAARLVAVVPFVVLLATAPEAVSLPAAVLFAAASVTDFFDGYLARVARVSTRFGRIVDPLADRLLIDSALILLVYHDRLPWWLALPLLLRDVLLMLVFRARHAVMNVQVNFYGKCATAAIMLALLLLMLTDRQWPLLIYALGLGLAGSAAAIYYRRPQGGLVSRPS